MEDTNVKNMAKCCRCGFEGAIPMADVKDGHNIYKCPGCGFEGRRYFVTYQASARGSAWIVAPEPRLATGCSNPSDVETVPELEELFEIVDVPNITLTYSEK